MAPRGSDSAAGSEANNRSRRDGHGASSIERNSFEQVLLKYHARTRSGLEAVLDGIDTPHANTVVFRFKQAYGPLLQRLDVGESPIVAKHVYEGQDPPPRMPT